MLRGWTGAAPGGMGMRPPGTPRRGILGEERPRLAACLLLCGSWWCQYSSVTGPMSPESRKGEPAAGPLIVQVLRSASGSEASCARRLNQVLVTLTVSVLSPSRSRRPTSVA